MAPKQLAAVICGICIVSMAVAVPIKPDTAKTCVHEFESFKGKHDKVYESDEHFYRQEVFCKNLEEIYEINTRPNMSWKAGMNVYSDLTWDEFKSFYTMQVGLWQNCSATEDQKKVWEMVEFGLAPPEKDWRNETCGETSCVSMVKNQGKCGSCWTFSTAGAMESVHAINTGMMTLLSEQQLVDCAQNFNNHGCNGGLPSQAFEYIMYSGGLSRMEDYPYVCGDGTCVNETKETCMVPPTGPAKVGATVSAVANFTEGDEKSMKTCVGLHSPISVGFQVVPDLRHYASGVYSSDLCANTADAINHAVLAVGYGTDDLGVDYWIIKNSWSFGWGDGGYFKMLRGKNMCGVATCASMPITHDKPTPPSVPFSKKIVKEMDQ